MTSVIRHASRCKRPMPVRRLSWTGEPELWCPACGRYAKPPAIQEGRDR